MCCNIIYIHFFDPLINLNFSESIANNGILNTIYLFAV